MTAGAVVVGEVIGVGIFLTPSGMAQSLASPFWLLVVWIAGGLVALSGALCLGELVSRYPEAGGPYYFLRAAYGDRVGFLYGWLSIFVLDPGLTATFAVGLSGYVVYIANDMIELPAWGLKVVALVTIVLMAIPNILGVRIGARVLQIIAALKLSLLAGMVIWGFVAGSGDWSNFVPFFERPQGSMALGGALAGAAVAAFFSFGGWWDASKIAGEVRNPTRNVPIALSGGVVGVTLTYIAVSAVFLYLVPIDVVDTGDAFAALAGEALFGRAGGIFFALIVIICVLGSLVAFLMAAPRVYFAMGRDGLFLPGLATLHPRFGTPARAILVQTMMASVIALTGRFDQILAYFIFSTIVFLLLTVGSVYIFRARSSEQPPAPIIGYPVTPLLFLIPTTALLFLLGSEQPWRTLVGIGVVLVGVPVFEIFFKRRKPLARD